VGSIKAVDIIMNINPPPYLQGVIIPFYCYSKIGRLSYHKSNILKSGLYNVMQLSKIFNSAELNFCLKGINFRNWLLKSVYLTNLTMTCKQANYMYL